MIFINNQEFLNSSSFPEYELTKDKNLGFTGRWFTKTINGEKHHVTLNQGNEFYFLVNNADYVNINFTSVSTVDTPFFAYSIDGQQPVRQIITENKVTLPSRDRHILRVICDGINENVCKFNLEIGFALHSVQAEGSGEITGIIPKNKIYAFYGDSITEGIRALNMNANSLGNSASNSFPWYCCQKLKVIPYHVGFGASGVLCKGSFACFMTAIDKLSATRDTDDTFSPDAVFVNHGTNDPTNNEPLFEQEYLKALKRLREKYKNVNIFCIIPFCQKHAEAIRKASSQLDNCYCIETDEWKITYTDGLHPDANGAKIIGEELAECIKKHNFI